MSKKNEIVNTILTEKVSAIIRVNNKTIAESSMIAAIEGGFKIIEFTLTTPSALDLITQFRSRDKSLCIGAGTVMNQESVDRAVDAGAEFIVSPIFNHRVVERCRELDVVAIPGTQTPTEMQVADDAGADFVKLFPSPPNVAEYISYILGPQPHLKIFPTAGININNMLDVLNAGAAGIGFVSPLFDPKMMEDLNFEGIRKKAETIFQELSKFNGNQKL
tara:strand:- start:22901 stop:23557 length:657 start_codon:yes stop_codon:yes gene_type:complete